MAGWFATFDEFAWTRAAGLVRLAWTITRNRHDAEDVAQEVLGRVYLKWNHVAACDRPEAYVYTILVNACRDLHRFSWNRREVSMDPGLLPDRAVGDVADRVTGQDEMAAMLGTLPIKQRTALALRYGEGLDDAVIAQIMGVRQDTVRSHCSKGLAALRRTYARAET